MEKRYRTFSDYCMETYHEKLYKIAIDAGMTCPNRDGTKGTRGCIFCSAGGSGDFAVPPGLPIREQIAQGKLLLSAKHTGRRFIAYYQAFTNTYASPDRLLFLYQEALAQPDIAGISIATRPDCLSDEVLHVLTLCQNKYPDKFIWVELGLQTCHKKSIDYIRRGYENSVFEQAMQNLKALSIPVIVHVILGLPNESEEDMYETIHYVNLFHPFGIKLQLLHVLEHTDLASAYRNGFFNVLSKETYLRIVSHCLELLSPDTVIHRITGDGPKKLLIAPLWSTNKKSVLNALHQYMKEHNIIQGSCYHGQ